VLGEAIQTVIRAEVAAGRSTIADPYALLKGLGEIAVNPDALAADLDANWEVLGEAIQTVIRAEVAAGRSTIADPYALLKELTRGKRATASDLADFIRGLDIGDAAKERLLALTPATYTGLAAELVDYLG
jgi:adenylosuccinate lyase